MQFVIPSRPTLARFAGVALLTCGNIATIYGAWQLRGMFGSPFGFSLANALIPFLLLCLPLVAICALFEFRGFKLSRLVGLEVKPGESPWLSAVGFGVLGAGWVFVKGGMSDREATKAEAALAKPTSVEPQHKPSPGREAIETVVFVVVLVLMLKLFVVEAFVIPTGSMAETLYGYKKIITCQECGYEFPVNASDEAEPTGGNPPDPTVGYCCPNCRYENPSKAKEVPWTSGDRVLVGKFLSVDDRGHVVVFKFPDAPQTSQTAQNYIKRLVGLPGETIAIYNGDLYATRSLTYPADARDGSGQLLYPRPENSNDEWRAPYRDNSRHIRWNGPDYGYPNTDAALDLFDKSRKEQFALGGKGFEIVRKPDELVMAMRRIVYDNDHQSKNLIAAGKDPRWQPLDAGAGWKPNDAKAPKQFAHSGGELGWVRYQHLVPEVRGDTAGWRGSADGLALSPRLITNLMGYNAGIQERQGQRHLDGSDEWVGDLMLECTATVAEGGSVVLQLSKGDHSYRAEFEGGKVRLKMFPNEEIGPDGVKRKAAQPPNVPVGDDSYTQATQSSGVKAGTAHRLRFANVDCRLRVWVDDKPIDFGGKADYAPPYVAAKEGTSAPPWSEADVQRPACIGASGAAVVSGLQLWRDTHYTHTRGSFVYDRFTNNRNDVSTYFVQPGHYLCMGDNSSQSSDGRMWGLVPERLMLGRAVFTFWPFERVGFIR